MTTLAVPYYGHLYHNSTGYERVYFIVSYDTATERPQEVRLGVWDQKNTPELDVWLRENGVLGVVCKDSATLPILEKVVRGGISVLSQGSRCAQTIMKKLLV